MMALIADLFACNRVNQKLINKYEHKPTPSHPRNNCIKLSLVTKINIKNVNNDKYDINLGRCGSVLIYSLEYICTSVDTVKTKQSIVLVKASKRKPHWTNKSPLSNQGNNLILQLLLSKTIS